MSANVQQTQPKTKTSLKCTKEMDEMTYEEFYSCLYQARGINWWNTNDNDPMWNDKFYVGKEESLDTKVSNR